MTLGTKVSIMEIAEKLFEVMGHGSKVKVMAEAYISTVWRRSSACLLVLGS